MMAGAKFFESEGTCAPFLIDHSSTVDLSLQGYDVTVVSAPGRSVTRSSGVDAPLNRSAQPSYPRQSLSVVATDGKLLPALAPPSKPMVWSLVPWIWRTLTGRDGLHCVGSSFIAPARETIAVTLSAWSQAIR